MTAASMNFKSIKAIALSVTDFDRALHFYTDVLSLRPAYEDGKPVGNHLGNSILLLKPNWNVAPSDTLNPRVTIETEDARSTEAALRAKGVTVTDPVAAYGGALVGSFLDSEGNKLWFCSGQGPS